MVTIGIEGAGDFQGVAVFAWVSAILVRDLRLNNHRIGEIWREHRRANRARGMF